MNIELLYQLALTEVPNIGNVHAKTLAEHFGAASRIFKAPVHELERLEGIGEVRAKAIHTFKDFSKAEKELKFIEKYGVKSLFITESAYPRRLLNCYDPPTMLFYKGSTDLNASKMVAIVGTRNNSEYGKSMTEKLVQHLSLFDCTIVSGLAFGIDALAHKCALKYGIPTIGVVGHGLDTIYPRENTQLARQMLKNGGILTEFRSRTPPDKHNFPSRNRVVAGITDATIIVESGIKGGSIITADIAGSYHRDVFAVPGRNIDTKSAGCNHLIRQNKAVILTDPEQFSEAMGWTQTKAPILSKQREIFVSLTENEKKVADMLTKHENVTIDELNLSVGISSSALAAALLSLEMHGVIQAMPGKRYRLVDR